MFKTDVRIDTRRSRFSHFFFPGQVKTGGREGKGRKREERKGGNKRKSKREVYAAELQGRCAPLILVTWQSGAFCNLKLMRGAVHFIMLWHCSPVSLWQTPSPTQASTLIICLGQPLLYSPGIGKECWRNSEIPVNSRTELSRTEQDRGVTGSL